MRYPLLFISAICLLAFLPINASGQTPAFEHYQQLNNAETRLTEFKDSDDMLRVKLQQLERINKSRKKYRVPPVELDILASRVGNKIALEGSQKKFMGHFNTKGENPYIRYALAGGMDHVKENAASISANQKLPVDDDALLDYMKTNHEAFMAERKPNDGHKQNCIDPHHTHVGLGLGWENNEFRYYEEFIDRYLAFDLKTSAVKVNEQFSVRFKPLSHHSPYTIIVYHEPFPKPMSPGKINRIYSYNDYGQSEILSVPPWELPKADAKGWLQFSFTPQKKGYYYVQLFLSAKPYKSGNATTEGKIQACGIVVRVE